MDGKSLHWFASSTISVKSRAEFLRSCTRSSDSAMLEKASKLLFAALMPFPAVGVGVLDGWNPN